MSSQALVTEKKKKRHFFSKRLHFTKTKEKSKSENVLNVDSPKGTKVQ